MGGVVEVDVDVGGVGSESRSSDLERGFEDWGGGVATQFPDDGSIGVVDFEEVGGDLVSVDIDEETLVGVGCLGGHADDSLVVGGDDLAF